MSNSFSKDTLLMFISKVLFVFFSVFANVIIARVLGPSGKGAVTIVVLLPSLAALFFSFGIGNANIFFSSKRKFKIIHIVENSVFITVLFGSVLTTIFICSVPIISKYFLGNYPSSLLYLSAPLIILTFISECFSGIFIGLRKISSYFMARVGRSIFLFGLVVILLVIFKIGSSGAVISGVLCFALEGLLLIYFIVRQGVMIVPRYQREVFRETIKFGFKGHLGTIFQYFNYRLDVFLIAYFLSPHEVGIYSIAFLIAEVILYFPTAISSILMAEVASQGSQASNVFTPLICRITLIVTFVGSIILLAAGKVMISYVFTSNFLPAILPLNLLLPGVIALSLWKVIINDLAGRGYPEYKSYTTGVSLVTTIFLDVLLIPRFGIAGAAIASSIAYMLTMGLAMHWFKNVSKVKVSNIFIPKSADLAMISRSARLHFLRS